MTTSSKTMGLVHLYGVGDADIRLVELVVMDWIEQPYAPPSMSVEARYSYEEPLSDQMIAQFKTWGEDTTSVRVFSGSYTNDRALSAPGQSFTSMLDLIDHVQRHGIQLTREYQGAIY